MVWIVYALMCAIWGTTWLVIKDGLHYLPPVTGVGLRFLVASVLLYSVAFVRGDLRPLRELPWRLIGMMSLLFFGLDYVLIYAAETHLDSGLVAVLFGTMPFFVFGFGYAIAREKTTPRVWGGAAIALIGVAVASLGELHASPLFVLAAIGAAAASAFGNLYVKRESPRAPLRTLPPAMLLAGIVESTVGLSFERVDWSLALAPHSLAAIAYLAVFGSGVAFFCNLWTLARLPAGIVGLTTLVIPVIAVLAGVLFGGEHLTTREAYGSATVALGIAVALLPRKPSRCGRAEATPCAA